LRTAFRIIACTGFGANFPNIGSLVIDHPAPFELRGPANTAVPITAIPVLYISDDFNLTPSNGNRKVSASASKVEAVVDSGPAHDSKPLG
jgi:hypothetical protein